MNKIRRNRSGSKTTLTNPQTAVATQIPIAMQFIKTGQFQKAIAMLEKTLSTQPKNPVALELISTAHAQTNDFAKAKKYLKRYIKQQPSSPDAWSNLGYFQRELGFDKEAIECFKKALKLAPNHPDALNNLGISLQNKNMLGEAIEQFQKAVVAAPNYIPSISNLGNALQMKGQYDEAIKHYNHALKIAPENFHVINNLANALVQIGKFEEAIDQFRKVLSINPKHAEAYTNLGNAYHMKKRFGEAKDAYQQAYRIAPNRAYALGNYAFSKIRICDWDGLEDIKQNLKRGIETEAPVISPFKLLPIHSDAKLQQQCARVYSNDKFRKLASNGKRTFANHASGKIRVGYISGDFKTHPVSFLSSGLIENHNRDEFEVIGFALNKSDESDIRKQLENSFDNFFDLSGMDLNTSTKLIAEKQLDILIDLGGYTQSAKPEILANRPAPVQVNYLGFPGTMGAGFMDSIIVDEFIAENSLTEGFDESCDPLPCFYMLNQLSGSLVLKPMTRQQAGLPDDAFVFCSFNNSYKISPEIFNVWMKCLQTIPGSVIWLRDADEKCKENLRKEAEEHQISADRIIFAPRVSIEDHYSRHALANLFLDTYPYNAHSTALDAVVTGLPVLTLVGSGFASRVAGSLNHHLNMECMNVHSLDDYYNNAVEMASDRNKLEKIREDLKTNLNSTRLYDPTRFCAEYEKILKRLATQYR